MSTFCVLRDKRFKAKAQELNLSEDALEQIVFEFQNRIGNPDRFPSDSYIEEQFRPKNNFISQELFRDFHRVWETRFRDIPPVSSLKEAELIKEDALYYFVNDAVTIKPQNDGTYLVQVAEPRKQKSPDTIVNSRSAVDELSARFTSGKNPNQVYSILVNHGVKRATAYLMQEAILKNTSLVGKTFKEIYEQVITGTDEQFKDKYNEYLRHEADQKLEKLLIKFLSKYHFIVNEDANLQEIFGTDALGAIDILNKCIYLAKNHNQVTLPEEFAHAFVELMGASVARESSPKYETVKDYNFLLQRITETSIYQQVYEQYKDVYVDKDGNPDILLIKKEAIGQALATAIVDKWEQMKAEKNNKGFWHRLYDMFINLVNKINNFLIGEKLDEYQNFSTLINKMAEEVLEGKHDRLKKLDDSDWRTLDYEETIEKQNKIDNGYALGLMQDFSGMGCLITGSLSYRRQGTVRRRNIDSLHDIDMVVPQSAHNIDFTDENLQRVITTTNRNTEDALLGILEGTDFVRQILDKHPKLKFFTAYVSDKKKQELVLSGVLSENEELAERFSAMDGSYESRLENFTEEERKQIYLLDFFIQPHNDELPDIVEDKKHNVNLTKFQTSFKNKLAFGRAKDIYDYQMFRIFEAYRDEQPSAKVMFQLNKDDQDAIANHGVEWSTDDVLSLFGGQAITSSSQEASAPQWEQADPSIKYNEKQVEAIEAAAQHIKDVWSGKKEQKYFVIEGKAGTGKTTIVPEIMMRVKSIATRRVTAGALTHEASTIVYSKLQKATSKANIYIQRKTIAAMLGKNKKQGKFNKGNNNPLAGQDVVIIDEASMINEADFIDLMNALEGQNTAVIFIGDAGQLPPIREGEGYERKKGKLYYKGNEVKEDALSPVFTSKKLKDSRVHLVERVRQGEESPILDYTDKYHKFGTDKEAKKEDYPLDTKQTSQVSPKGAIIFQRNNGEGLFQQIRNLLNEMVHNHKPNLFRVVAYRTNDTGSKESAVNYYNRKCRELLFGEDVGVEFIAGDIINCNDSYYVDRQLVTQNSESGQVISASAPRVLKVEGYMRKVLEDIDEDETVDSILEDVQVQDVELQMSDGRKVVVPALVNTQSNRKAFNSNIDKLKEIVNKHKPVGKANPYYEPIVDAYSQLATSIGFGYAITSHKSQGSTYDVVVVDANDINAVSKTTLKSKAKSTYTALTRAANVTVVITDATNESRIYTDFNDINNQVKKNKENQTDEPIDTEVEDVVQRKVSEKEAKDMIYGLGKKAVKATSEDETIDLSGLVKGSKKKANKVEEEEDEDNEDENEDEEEDTDEEDEDIEDEDEEDDEDEGDYDPQQAAYDEFVQTQTELGNNITFNEKTHEYTININGKKQVNDCSVTELRDMMFPKKISGNRWLPSRVLGTETDKILRLLIAGEEEEARDSAINMTDEQYEQLKEDAKELVKRVKKMYGKNAIMITDENLLRVAAYMQYWTENNKWSDRLLVAGTMDMVVIDEDGNKHIIDFKTFNSEKKDDIDDETKFGYRVQLQLYKRASLFADDKTTTGVALFRLRYTPSENYSVNSKGQIIYEGASGKKAHIVKMKGYESPTLQSVRKYSDDTDGYVDDMKIEPVKTAMQKRQETKKVARTTAVKANKGKQTIDVTYKNPKYKTLSNMWFKSFTIEDSKGKKHTFKSVEHYFQWRKALFVYYEAIKALKSAKASEKKKLEKLRDQASDIASKIQKEQSAFEVRKLGKHELKMNTAIKEAWDEVREDVLEKAMRLGFESEGEANQKARQLLISTGDAILTHSVDESSAFPEILMKLRSEYQDEDSGITKTSDKEFDKHFKVAEETGYPARTRENVEWSTTTIAVAENFASPGEKLTAGIAKKDDKYVNAQIKDLDDINKEAKRIAAILYKNWKGKKKKVKLNIAGNAIDGLEGKQSQYNQLMTAIIQELQKKGITIDEIRSGGQTGMDEAGIVAAQNLGIKWSVLAPKGWMMRNANGEDIRSEKRFKDRFKKSEPKSIKEEKKTVKTKESKSKKSEEENYDFKGKMFETYGKKAGKGIKSKTTLQAIENGERTATTRYAHYDYWKDVKEGDIVLFEDNDGNSIRVKITKAPAFLRKGKNKTDWNKIRKEWCKKEGWSEEKFDEDVRPHIEAGEAFQMEFEYIDSPSDNANEDVEWIRTHNGNKVGVSTRSYKKNDPKEHQDTAYVFTENAQAASFVYDGTERQKELDEEYDLEYPADIDDEKYCGLKLNVKGTDNQATIRMNEDDEFQKNAFGVVVKKRQQGNTKNKYGVYEWLAKEGQFTEEDEAMFKAYNLRMFDELEKSGLKKIVLPSQMARGKAALPQEFAEWLANEIKERFGVEYEVVENENEDYEGYGLKFVEQQKESTEEEDEDKEEFEGFEEPEEQPEKSAEELLAEAEQGLTIFDKQQQTVKTAQNLDGAQSEIYSIQLVNDDRNVYTAHYELSVDDFTVSTVAAMREVHSLALTLPISSLLSMKDDQITEGWAETVIAMDNNPLLHRAIGSKTITITSEDRNLLNLLAQTRWYNKKTKELTIPQYTVGMRQSEILERNSRDELANSDLFVGDELRQLSKNAMYKLSAIITELQNDPTKYAHYFKGNDEEAWNEDKVKDLDLSSMSRIEIINAIGLDKLMSLVREMYFNPEYADDDVSFDTLDKLDVIYNNWNAFIQLAYDTLIGLEEIAISSRYRVKENVMTDQDTDIDDLTNEEVQEIFGDSLEHWMVGFRQVSAFASLSKMLKQFFDSLIETDENGNPKLDTLGQEKHINAQQAVAKILYWTQGARNIEHMIDILKSHTDTDYWLNKVIEKLENENEEQFQSQFWVNFKKYFQRYAVIVNEKGGKTKKGKNKSGGKKVFKIINENEAANSVLWDIRRKESAETKLGNFKLRNKDGSVNMDNFNELKKLSKSLDDYVRTLQRRGKIAEVLKTKKALNEFNTTLKQILDILDIPIPANAFNDVLNVKKNIKDMAARLDGLVKGIQDIVDHPTKRVNGELIEKEISRLDEYKNIIELINKNNGIELEAVSYEAGKLYYSYVMPSYLGRMTDALKEEDSTIRQKYYQEQFGQYEWFYKDGNWRNYILQRLFSNQEARNNFQHIVSLHYDGTTYVDKAPVEYIASMIEHFYYAGSKYGYFRIPTMADKPSEEYYKFERFDINEYESRCLDGLMQVFFQEFDRIRAVEQRRWNDEVSQYDIIDSFDTEGVGNQFLFLSYLQPFLDGTYSTVYGQQLAKNGWESDADEFHEQLMQYIDKAVEPYNGKNPYRGAVSKKRKGSKGTTGVKQSQFIKNARKFIKMGVDNAFQDAMTFWRKEGFITKNKAGKDVYFNKMKLSDKKLRNFFWQDHFMTTQMMQILITDMAFYQNAEDLQKRMAQVHAPGSICNIYATYTNAQGVKERFTKDGIHRSLTFKEPIVASSTLKNVEKAFDNIIARAPKNQRAGIERQKQYALKQLKKIKWSDAQAFSSLTSYRKKLGIYGLWDSKLQNAYEILSDIENHPDANFEELIDVVMQPLKPFTFAQTKVEGKNDFFENMRVGMQFKNSDFVLIFVDAITRAGNQPNLLRAVSRFMEETQEMTQGSGIDTVMSSEAVKTGNAGVVDLTQILNDSWSEIEDETGDDGYFIEEVEDRIVERLHTLIEENPQVVHETPFEDYIIQQNVPAHFGNRHSQAHGSQTRILTVTDMLDIDPVTGEANKLKVDGVEMTVKEAKTRYFNAIADNINLGVQALVKKFGLDQYPKQHRNVMLSRILRDAILEDGRFGYDLLWACDVDKYGNFNIPLSDPIHSGRIQQLLNSIIKKHINKQEIPGGPIVQVTSYGLSEDLHIRYKGANGEIFLTEEEFSDFWAASIEHENYEIPKGFRDPSQYETYEEYIADQDGIAYFEAIVPIYDPDLIKDFLTTDEDGNQYIDVEEMERVNPKLLEMVGYRIPTESKYSMVPIKIKGFLAINSGEGIMLPADITTLSGSDFDVDKMYVMRYTLERVEMDDGSIKYVEPLSGKGKNDNIIISTMMAVLQSQQVERQLLTPGNFDTVKKIAYTAQVARNFGTEYNTESKKDTFDLKDMVLSKKNLTFNHVQSQFHKQNTIAKKMIPIFAQSNVSHGFMSLMPTFMYVDKADAFTLDGVTVKGKFEIDMVYARDGQTLISNNIAELLAASVDAVKDPVLNFLNINKHTANYVTTLLRMGFNLEQTCLLIGQPIVEEVVSAVSLATANQNNQSFASTINSMLEKMQKENPELKEINKVTTDLKSLKQNLNKSENEYTKTDYMVLMILSKLDPYVRAFSKIVHMTRYNSISSAVGPFASNTMMDQIKEMQFYADPILQDEGIQKAVNNPILKAFREGSKVVEQKLLGENFVQASSAFRSALQMLSAIFPYLNDQDAQKFSDFYMSFMANGVGAFKVFNTSYEHRMHILKDFPQQFIHLQNKYNDNDFIRSINYVYTDTMEYPVLRLNTRRLSSTTVEDLKNAWVKLYNQGGEARNLALTLIEYNFFRGGFGFSPITFMNAVPSLLKQALPNYVNNLDVDNPNSIPMYVFVDHVIHQFILHNPDQFIKKKLKDIDEYEYEEMKDGRIKMENKDSYDKKIAENISVGEDLVMFGNQVYHVEKVGSVYIYLRKVDALGGNGAGFEASIEEEFPKSVFEGTTKGSQLTWVTEKTIDRNFALAVFEEMLDTVDEGKENKWFKKIKGVDSNLVKQINQMLYENGYHTQVTKSTEGFFREVFKEFKTVEELQEMFDDMDEELKDVCK